MVGCHCWMPFDRAPLLAAIAGRNRREVAMTHFDRPDVVPLLGAMARCHCWVTAHLCGLDVPSDRVPLLGAMWSGAMVRCHCWVPLLGRGACTRCGFDAPSDRVPLLGAMVRCHCWDVGGVDVVPLLGAMW